MLQTGIRRYPGTITSGTALSSPIAIGADTLEGIAMPAAWTTANITFQTSFDGGTTWLELINDAGTAVTLTGAAAGSFILLATTPKYAWRGVNLIKVRSGTSGSPMNQ